MFSLVSILILMSGNHKDKNAPPATAGGPCERCGRPEAEVRCGGSTLCLDCYYLAGSCCLEFGADDLWRDTGTGTT